MRGSLLLSYILRRLVQIIPVVLGVVVLNFLLLQLAPGDLATVLAGEAGGAPKEYIDQLRQRFGQDQPVLIQLARYLGNLLMLDLGYSFRQSAPVLDLLLDRLWPTLLLMGTTLVLSLGIGIIMGLLAAVWVRTWKDHAISIAAIIFYATPLFWVGLMLILVFSVLLGWLPTSGRGTTVDILGLRTSLFTLDGLRHLILPALNLAIPNMALMIRLVAAGTTEAKAQDYVKYARAKGVRPRRIVGRHILRNILIPVVTVVGIEFGSLIAFSTITETVFAWPGMGKLLIDSIYQLDRPIVVSYIMLATFLFVSVNLLVDLLYAALDPRVRLVGEPT